MKMRKTFFAVLVLIALTACKNNMKDTTDVIDLLTSSLVRYFYLPHDGTCDFKGVSEDLTGDSG